MARWRYPLLKQAAWFYRDVDLSNTLLIACQHLLGTQYQMFRTLISAGLKPENCIVIGKSYSANARVVGMLKRLGCIIAPFSLEFEPRISFDVWFSQKLAAYIESIAASRNLASYDKVVILDDGGLLHEVANRLLAGNCNLAGVEQTASGEARIRQISPEYKVISIARWWSKRELEAPTVGQHACDRITCHLQSRDKSDPRILVCGLGSIGNQIFGRLKLKGYQIWGIDPDPRVYSRLYLQQAMQQGFILRQDELTARLGEFDVIIGATGKPVLSEEDIERAHPAVSLISVSSTDREFPSAIFRQGDEDGSPHDDYYLEDRCLVNGGFPITFKGLYHEAPPEMIELTIANLLICVMHQSDVSNISGQHFGEVSNALAERWKQYGIASIP